MFRTIAVSAIVSLACWLSEGKNYVCPDASSDEVVPTVVLGNPSNCQDDASACSFYVTMAPNIHNSSYVDIHLEGDEEGWVAVGFSTNQVMQNDDVLGCKYDPSTFNVSVVDAWNPEPQYAPNVIDPNQDGVCTYSTAYNNGRISCYFSRYYSIVNPDFDYDLNQSYYLLLGLSVQGGTATSNFHKHLPNTPVVSDSPINVYSTNNSNGTSNTNQGMQLIQAHGALMVLAFLLGTFSAVFVAAWTKPLFPKGAWFKAHAIVMAAALVLACAGLVTVIVANKDNSPPGLINVNQCATKTTHFVIGISMMALMATNPIVAFFRCKVDSPRRWVFFAIHGIVIGALLQILALVNIGIGLFLFQSGCGTTTVTATNNMFWLYVAWLVFFVTVQLTLFATFSLKAFRARDEAQATIAPTLVKYIFYQKRPAVSIEEEMHYVSMDEDATRKIIPAKLKLPNAVTRIGFLSVFLTITASVAIALVAMISAGVNYGDN